MLFPVFLLFVYSDDDVAAPTINPNIETGNIASWVAVGMGGLALLVVFLFVVILYKSKVFKCRCCNTLCDCYSCRKRCMICNEDTAAQQNDSSESSSTSSDSNI